MLAVLNVDRISWIALSGGVSTIDFWFSEFILEASVTASGGHMAAPVLDIPYVDKKKVSTHRRIMFAWARDKGGVIDVQLKKVA